MSAPAPVRRVDRRTLRWIALLCLLCVPSAYIAWHGRDIPQLGSLGDDAVYLVSAKSLGTGQGYRILSLPGAPAQTKYPPAYPFLLSLVWRLSPRFPDNMPVAAVLAWLMLPLLISVAHRVFTRLGFSPVHAGVLCGLMAVSAPVVWFSVNLMPELLFTSVLLASTMAADSDRDGWGSAGAGLLAGMAYLLKSAALPLLVTSPLLYLLRRRHRSAALFVGAMLPCVAGWMWWARAHQGPPGDSTWTFYTDYLAYQVLNVPWGDYPLVVWTNLKALWASLGELTAAPVFDGALGRLPAYAVATATVAGVVLLARRKFTHYQAFAVGLFPLLVLWHYPPIPRFAFPLLPLLLAGLCTAVLEAWRVVSSEQSMVRRAIAWPVLAMLAALAPLAPAAIYGGPLIGFYRLAGQAREQRSGVLPEYAWIEANLPPDAAFVANDDAVLYLYTGHPAISLHTPPTLLYHEDRAGIAREYRAIDAFAARNHLRYLLRTTLDFKQDFTPAMGAEVVDGLLADPRRFRLVHRSGQSALYEVSGASNASFVRDDPGLGRP